MSIICISTFCYIAVEAKDKTPENVPNRSYYKDVFFDCGIGLTSRDTLPAFKLLNLSNERVAFDEASDAEKQNGFIAGDSTDWNGRLLYPDGQPRYKMIFLDGGSSLNHGASLGSEGRQRIREFFNAGGSYVGTCAGAIITAQGFEKQKSVPSYLGIWPGLFMHTGKAQTYMGFFIEENSPLLKYYDFGGDKYVSYIRHNMGNFPKDLPAGAEVLARYDFRFDDKVHNQPSVVAYKPSEKTGRMVLCGSHPEEVINGERRDLAAAMIQYAIDGIGLTKLKGTLENGVERKMDKYSYENKPDYARIGDLQYHHFTVDIPKGARDVTFTLQGADGSNLMLALSKTTYAYEDCADLRSTLTGAHHEFCLNNLQPGTWYVTVKCLDTVEAENTPTGHVYKPAAVHDLLNGVPYSIKVSWK